jgi:hypothetical protein
LIIDGDQERGTIMSDTLSAAVIATGQEDKIRQRAYEIWESEGRAGSPEEHWYRAERELLEREPEHSEAAPAAETGSAATGEVPDERFAE